jgi:hypothetical protein
VEETMVKHFSICAMFVTLATGTPHAQQQEAVLAKTTAPGVGFDIVLAMAKPGSGTIDLRGLPEPTVAYIADGALALAIDDEVLRTFKDIGSLQKPNCIFHADSKGRPSVPLAIYVISNGETRVTQEDTAAEGRTLTMSLTKMDLPAAEFDVVFGLTKFPGTGKLVFKYEAEEMLPAIVRSLSPSCVTHVAQNDGTADVITVYVVPKESALTSATR